MSSLAQIQAAEQHLQKLVAKNNGLHCEIKSNIYCLIEVCGKISDLLQNVNRENPAATWLDITALVWVYTATCDNGLRLLRQYKKARAQWSGLQKDLVALRRDLPERLLPTRNQPRANGR